jgi:hypothetical protein
MLTFYCDDSGTNYRTPFCVLAGYIARAESWERFSDEWKAELNRSPYLKCLKMSQAYALKEQFSGWTESDREDKLVRLARVIQKHVSAAFGSYVSNQAFCSFVKNYVPRTVNHPYWLCLNGVVGATIKHVNTKQRINLVFDRQGEGFERRARLMEDNFRSMCDPPYAARLGTLTFADGDKSAPLQAAEMLCWSIRDYADSRALGSPTNRPAAEILWSVETITNIWDGKAMEKFVDRYQRLHPESPVNRPDLHRPKHRVN